MKRRLEAHSTDPTDVAYLEKQKGRAFWRIAWPAMLSTALVSGLSLVDMAFISRLGTIQVAAVSTSSSVVRLLTGVGTGIATAVLGLSARSVGADRPNDVYRIGVHGIGLALTVGLALCTAVAVAARTTLSLFTRDPELLILGTVYLRFMLAGLVLLFGYAAVASLFHSWGDTRRPLLIMVIANGLNVVLDPVLIFGLGPFPELGLRGAGLASFIGNAVACSVGLWMLARNPLFRRGRRQGPGGLVRAGLVGNIVRIALPASAQAVTRPASGMVLLWIVSFYGTSALAAFGIGLKLTMLSGVFMTGLTAAVASILGRELGAERVRDARDTVSLSLRVGLAVFVPVALFYFAGARPMMRLFAVESEVVEIGVRYIRILSPSLILLAVMATFSGVFQGAGYTQALMYTSLIANLPAKLGVAAVLGLVWPADLGGVWFAIAGSIVLEAGLLGLWYRSGRWYRHKNIDWRTA